jgi:hypothetical protein
MQAFFRVSTLNYIFSGIPQELIGLLLMAACMTCCDTDITRAAAENMTKYSHDRH